MSFVVVLVMVAVLVPVAVNQVVAVVLGVGVGVGGACRIICDMITAVMLISAIMRVLVQCSSFLRRNCARGNRTRKP